MQRVERNAEIAAPPEELFAFLADLDNLPDWQTGITSARRTSGGPMAAGATAIVTRQLMGQLIEAPVRVAAYEPPGRLVIETSVSSVRGAATLEIAPAPAGSTLTFRIEVSASGFTAFMEPMIASTAASDIESSLARLRERFAAPDR